MTSEFSSRPELILGPNPFIEALPPYLTAQEMARQFGHYPLADKPWQQLAPAMREPLLEFAYDHIAPTSIALPVAMAIQSLIRRSMCQRNPLKAEEQRRCNTIGVAEDLAKIRETHRLDAAGGTLEGMTGMGKTTIAHRALQLVAPSQVIHHEASQACGWHRLVQVVWLYVDYPSNGTRGALLKRILSALDEVAGTDYSAQYMRVTNIDALLTQVCKVLSLHRVALLIIDEKQERNFHDSPWSLEFVLFYLSLMNLGIAILLIGNPMAFGHLRAFSQVVRRFSTGGMHRLNPAPNEQEPWWAEDFVPRMHKFSLVEESTGAPDERAKLEFELTAGVPGLLQLLHVEAQRSALRRAKGTRATLDLEDLRSAVLSPAFSQAKKIAEQVTNQGTAEHDMSDIPARGEPVRSGGLDGLNVADLMTIDAVKRMVTNYQSHQSKELKKVLGRLTQITGMSREELQILGMSEDLLTEVRAAQNQLEQVSGKRSKGKSKSPPSAPEAS